MKLIAFTAGYPPSGDGGITHQLVKMPVKQQEVTVCNVCFEKIKHKKKLTLILHRFLKSLVTNLAKIMTDENSSLSKSK